ncbi:FAD-binding oxidoreductase [Candidatus Solincola sp.]|nr:FAD-binding protein [Actinomycetota bacterium]
MRVGTVLEEIRDIVGPQNVSREASAIGKYYQESGEGSRLTLVRPADEYELSEVMVLAEREKIPVYSVRREKMEGAPPPGEGLLIDLSRMDGIKEIDRRNLMGHIYAGVTYERLQEECLKRDCKLLLPAAAESRSVLRSYLDRDILNGNAVYRFPNLSIFHAVLSDGRIWVSGSQQLTAEGIADFREDQGPQFSLFFGASEDIFGIPFYGIVYLYPLREERRVFLFGFDSLEPALELAYKVNREEHCFECLTANSRYLSVLLSRDAEGAEALRAKLPPWVTALSMEHHVELVDLWEKYVRADAEALGARELDAELAAAMDARFKRPWYLFERDYLKGRTAVIQHYDFKKRAPGLLSGLRELASARGYPAEEVGQALIPVYFGGSFYCETDLYFRPADEAERARVEETVREGYRYLLDESSFVDRPRGEVAEMVFARTDPGFLKVMRTFKNIVDPAGIMNPGQLLKEV